MHAEYIMFCNRPLGVHAPKWTSCVKRPSDLNHNTSFDRASTDSNTQHVCATINAVLDCDNAPSIFDVRHLSLTARHFGQSLEGRSCTDWNTAEGIDKESS